MICLDERLLSKEADQLIAYIAKEDKLNVVSNGEEIVFRAKEPSTARISKANLC